MIGVNVDNIDSLIKKNNMYLNSFNTSKTKLIETINELDKCYSGTSLEFLFIEPQKEKKNIDTISKMIENYSDILYLVKYSYINQDQHLKSQINHMNSNIL